MTLGDDVINATVTNSLSATDKIIDASTTDKDVLTAKMNAAAAATIVNVETVNIDWTSNADLAVTATNMTNNLVHHGGVMIALGLQWCTC
jgi:hypothetical protein